MSPLTVFIKTMSVKGSITVFVSLCLAVCILFAQTALEAARIPMIRANVHCAMEAALNSLFACYDGDLCDAFGILMLNREDLPGFVSMDELLRSELKANLNPKSDRFVAGGNFLRADVQSLNILETRSAVEMGGELFCRSVVDFMKYRSLSTLLNTVAKDLLQVQEGDAARAGQRTEETQKPEMPEEESSDGDDGENREDGEEQDYEELVEESFLGKVNELRKRGVLPFVVPSLSAVSSGRTDKLYFPSVEHVNTVPLSAAMNSQLANFLFSEYVMEYFRDFTDGTAGPVLSYEMEYILFGNASDRENLEDCVDRLMLLREGMNILTICRHSSLSSEASAFASALVGWTGFPPVIQFVKTLTIGAWAYAESIVDVRTLLAGGGIPLLKGPGDWNLSLKDIPSLLEGRHHGIGKAEEGLKYEEYLRMLLMTARMQEKSFRAMDMIQCRLAAIKPRFRMRECVYSVEAEVYASALPLFLRFGRGSMPLHVFRAGGARMY